MNKEELIQKWLDHNLNAQELEAFKQLEDYEALTKLDTNLKHFKAPEHNTSESLEQVLSTIKSNPLNKTNWISTAMKIAAVFVICFGVYFYTTTLDTTFNTIASQKQSIELPDTSVVELNAMSTLAFNKSNWTSKREVTLQGEAFFKVAKGSQFDVKTEDGIISVLGTQFNVKQRDNYFEVICYEGKVAVTYKANTAKLLPGDSFFILDGKLFTTEKENQSTPSWLQNQSRFKSLPYREVIAEFERQHDVLISLENIDDSQLFTGSFTHNDIEIALKSITLPLHLTYSKTDNIITLKRE
ncbi:FecR family protein [Psychroserpens ponticola]|uniref:FecR family protein n=1 Tax=Psychroserpens ponticola TaxID=2932268 RepID=A0ABY7S1R7_9FLAO|nr:FecR family protein [Psychroserpens ponticola]WCO02401.1 FecR family protein [Psychroserpens ponticola]